MTGKPDTRHNNSVTSYRSETFSETVFVPQPEKQSLVERLELVCKGYAVSQTDAELNAEAAIAIRKLVSALEPIAAIPFDEFDNGTRTDDTPLMAWNHVPLTIGHVKSARILVAKYSPPQPPEEEKINES